MVWRALGSCTLKTAWLFLIAAATIAATSALVAQADGPKLGAAVTRADVAADFAVGLKVTWADAGGGLVWVAAGLGATWLRVAATILAISALVTRAEDDEPSSSGLLWVGEWLGTDAAWLWGFSGLTTVPCCGTIWWSQTALWCGPLQRGQGPILVLVHSDARCPGRRHLKQALALIRALLLVSTGRGHFVGAWHSGAQPNGHGKLWFCPWYDPLALGDPPGPAELLTKADIDVTSVALNFLSFFCCWGASWAGSWESSSSFKRLKRSNASSCSDRNLMNASRSVDLFLGSSNHFFCNCSGTFLNSRVARRAPYPVLLTFKAVRALMCCSMESWRRRIDATSLMFLDAGRLSRLTMWASMMDCSSPYLFFNNS